MLNVYANMGLIHCYPPLKGPWQRQFMLVALLAWLVIYYLVVSTKCTIAVKTRSITGYDVDSRKNYAIDNKSQPNQSSVLQKMFKLIKSGYNK